MLEVDATEKEADDKKVAQRLVDAAPTLKTVVLNLSRNTQPVASCWKHDRSIGDSEEDDADEGSAGSLVELSTDEASALGIYTPPPSISTLISSFF